MELLVSIQSIHDIPRYKELGMTGCILSCDYFATRQNHYFTKEEIVCAMQENKEVQFYTIVNRIFAQDELSQLEEFLVWCKEVEFAGIYYSDPAVYMLAKKYGMENILIYNQDTVLTNSLDIQGYLDLGIKRCVISREITLDEILTIMDRCEDKLELMVHGHMNLSYSKRRLLSCYFDEIGEVYSTDKMYTLEEETRKDKMYITQDEQGTHIFTGTRLQMVKELPVLLSLQAIRIDGVFMSSDEIADAIMYYAQILNGKDVNEVYDAFIAKDEELYTSGYLYQKTNIVK